MPRKQNKEDLVNMMDQAEADCDKESDVFEGEAAKILSKDQFENGSLEG